MNRSRTTEAQILAEIRLALGKMPDVRCFRRQVGRARDPNTGAIVRFGEPGQSDLYGWVQGGLHWEIEVKAPKGRMSDDQKAWQSTCARFGVPHCVARSVEEAVDFVEGLKHGQD